MRHLQFDSRRIRWIAFDAVGTLITPDPPVAEVYHRAAVKYGSRLTAHETGLRFRSVFQCLERDADLPCGCADAGDLLHSCEIRELLRWRTIVERVLDDIVSCEECFQELFAHFGQPSAWRCFPEVESTLQSLNGSGFHLAVASNFDARLQAVMNGLPALRFIEQRVISSEIGSRKPSHRLFESLLRMTDCTPVEILYVGDDRKNDLETAEACGIKSLLIDRSERLEPPTPAERTVPEQTVRTLRSLAEITDYLQS